MMLELLSLSKLQDFVLFLLFKIPVVLVEVIEVSVNFSIDFEEFVLVQVNVIWVVFISWIEESEVSGVENLIILFPCFSLSVYEGTSLCVNFWVVFSAVILEEFVRGNGLGNWRHNVHECLGVLDIVSLTNFE